MGLDIYFYGVRNGNEENVAKYKELVSSEDAIWQKVDKLPEGSEEREKLNAEALALSQMRSDSYPYEELAYFRKVNFLMSFFSYEGNGVLMSISEEQIEDLIERCDIVLESKSEDVSAENLPTQGGYFFGSTEYDEYYYEDVERVRMEFEGILARLRSGELVDVYMDTWW